MGQVTLTAEELEAMLDRAAERGAYRALHDLGLRDEAAVRDLAELRSVLGSWRETRKAAWQTIVRIITTGVLMFIVVAVWSSIKTEVWK